MPKVVEALLVAYGLAAAVWALFVLLRWLGARSPWRRK